MSRYFRPPLADPFWDSFWSSERTFFDSHFGSTLSEEDFLPSAYFIRRRPLGAPRSPLLGPHSPMQGQQANPLERAFTQQQHQQQQSSSTMAQQQQQQQQQVGGTDLMMQLNNANNDKYQIMVDVSHFNPEEISVKMVDNAIVVTGKHEDKADTYGYVSRQFSRKYLLPADVEPETVTSTLSADGILTIKAPRKLLQISDSAAGRSVPIAISNQPISPHLNLAPPQFPPMTPLGQPNLGSSLEGTMKIERTTKTTTSSTSGTGSVPGNADEVPVVPTVVGQQQPPSAPQS